MCRVPEGDFRVDTDDFEDGAGERVIISCPVGICQMHEDMGPRTTLADLLRVAREHRDEGIH